MADEEHPGGDVSRETSHGEHGEHGAPGSAAGKKPDKNEKRKTAIIVILTAVGVLIAWMTLRKNPGSQATGAAAAPTGSSANDPLNYPTSNGDVAGFGLGQTAGFDPNAYMGLQQQLDQLNNTVSRLAGTQGSTSTGSGNINIYTDPPPSGWFPWSPHSGTVAQPHPLAGMTAQGVLRKGQSLKSLAAELGVPLNAIQTGPGGHWWTYAPRKHPNEGMTAQGVLSRGESVGQWAALAHVPVGSVQHSGSHVWTYATRS